MKNRIWRTAKGEDIQVRQMETSHIRNSLGLIWLQKNIAGRSWRRKYVPRLMGELQRRQAEGWA